MYQSKQEKQQQMRKLLQDHQHDSEDEVPIIDASNGITLLGLNDVSDLDSQSQSESGEAQHQEQQQIKTQQKITNQQILKPQLIIEKLAYFNLFYKNDLIDAINQSYLYSETKEYFIKKIRRSNDVQTDNLQPKFDFLTKLIQNNSYQSFICLQNIATHFPFLFEPESNQNNGHSLFVLEIVLPALNFFSQMFSLNETDKNLNDLKKAFSALSFFNQVHKWKFIFIIDIILACAQFVLIIIPIVTALYQSTSFLFAFTSPIFIFVPVVIVSMEILTLLKR